MTNHAGFMPFDGTSKRLPTSTVNIGALNAEYSTGRRPGGEWFALANVDAANETAVGPAWMVIGTGSSAEAALRSLTSQIERQTLGDSAE